MDLDARSENGDKPEGNGTVTDGSGMLVLHEQLSLGGMELLLHTINAIYPTKKDSLLLHELDLYNQNLHR